MSCTKNGTPVFEKNTGVFCKHYLRIALIRRWKSFPLQTTGMGDWGFWRFINHQEDTDQDQLAFCEDSREDEEQDILLNHISWSTCDFKDVQRFLDEINEALASIIDTVDADADGYWEIHSEFALAKCQWNGTKFELVGVLY